MTKHQRIESKVATKYCRIALCQKSIADPSPQYTNVNATVLRYDASGNLTNDGTWGYTYDPENRLTIASNATQVLNYTYDALGRLIERLASTGPTPRTYRCFYAGWQLIEARNSAGDVIGKWVYGAGLDEPVRFINNPGTTLYYHQDALGNVTELTGTGANVQETYTYDVYGTPTIRNSGGTILSSSAFDNVLMFNGRMRDLDTGLYNYRYRYYHPTLGRFVQIDPAGLGVEDLNQYAYVVNNPVTWGDPFGLERQIIGTVPGPNGQPVPIWGDPSNPQSSATIGSRTGNDPSGTERVLAEAYARAYVDYVLIPVAAELILTRSVSLLEKVPCINRLIGKAGKALSNPFKGKNPKEIDSMFKAKGFEPRGPDPIGGKGGYVNPENGRSYHIDPNNRFGEPPHLDVNRPKAYTGELEKKKYEY